MDASAILLTTSWKLAEQVAMQVDLQLATLPTAPVAAVPPPTTQDPSEAIDYYLAAGWKARGVEPAALCDDATFVRRIYLDLAGRMIRDICYGNARTFLGLPEKAEAS